MTINNQRVIVAEDDILLGDLYKTQLEISGIIVMRCTDGQEVIDQIQTFNPDLILLDLMMPNLSGFAVIEKVRAMPGIQQPKIVVLTALGEPEDKDRALKLGADEYLVKSGVALEQVLTTVQRALGMQHGAATPTPT